MSDHAEKPSIVRVHCNSCGKETKHEVVAERKIEGSQPYDDDISVWWVTHYTMLECRGCETVCLKKEYYFSEWDQSDAQVEFFPPPTSRDLPNWMSRLPKDEQEVMSEIYRALGADSRRLALMGARTLVDMFILRQIGDHGSFDEKLKELASQGFLSAKNREVLDVALDAGNASAHRGYKPTPAHLDGVMDIVENLLHADLLRADASQIKASVPPRPPRKKKPTK